MDLIDNDFSIYLENYKNQFIAEGVNNTNQNKSLLESAKSEINNVLSNLTLTKNTLLGENKKLQKRIRKMNSTIEKTKKKHTLLESESTKLINSDLGAIEQNKNYQHVFKMERIQMVLKLCLIVLIFIFLYNRDDIIQTIRNKLPKKTE